MRHTWGPVTWVKDTNFNEATCARCGMIKRVGKSIESRTGWKTIYLTADRSRAVPRHEHHCKEST